MSFFQNANKKLEDFLTTLKLKNQRKPAKKEQKSYDDLPMFDKLANLAHFLSESSEFVRISVVKDENGQIDREKELTRNSTTASLPMDAKYCENDSVLDVNLVRTSYSMVNDEVGVKSRNVPEVVAHIVPKPPIPPVLLPVKEAVLTATSNNVSSIPGNFNVQSLSTTSNHASNLANVPKKRLATPLITEMPSTSRNSLINQTVSPKKKKSNSIPAKVPKLEESFVTVDDEDEEDLSFSQPKSIMNFPLENILNISTASQNLKKSTSFVNTDLMISNQDGNQNLANRQQIPQISNVQTNQNSNVPRVERMNVPNPQNFGSLQFPQIQSQQNQIRQQLQMQAQGQFQRPMTSGANSNFQGNPPPTMIQGQNQLTLPPSYQNTIQQQQIFYPRQQLRPGFQNMPRSELLPLQQIQMMIQQHQMGCTGMTPNQSQQMAGGSGILIPNQHFHGTAQNRQMTPAGIVQNQMAQMVNAGMAQTQMTPMAQNQQMINTGMAQNQQMTTEIYQTVMDSSRRMYMLFVQKNSQMDQPRNMTPNIPAGQLPRRPTMPQTGQSMFNGQCPPMNFQESNANMQNYQQYNNFQGNLQQNPNGMYPQGLQQQWQQQQNVNNRMPNQQQQARAFLSEPNIRSEKQKQ